MSDSDRAELDRSIEVADRGGDATQEELDARLHAVFWFSLLTHNRPAHNQRR